MVGSMGADVVTLVLLIAYAERGSDTISGGEEAPRSEKAASELV